MTAGTAIEGRREVEATCLKRALEVMKSTRGDGKGSRGRARRMWGVGRGAEGLEQRGSGVAGGLVQRRIAEGRGKG